MTTQNINDQLVKDGDLIPTGDLTTNGFAALGVEVVAGVPGTTLVDSVGNIPSTVSGQWIPRTGLLSDLLTVTLNPGEVATATNIDALVVNDSAISALGKASFRGRWLGSFSVQGIGDTAIANNGVVKLDASSLDKSTGILTDYAPTINTTDAANNYIDLSALIAVVGNITLNVSGKIGYLAGATFDGSFRGSTLQTGTNSSTFTSVDVSQIPFVATSNIVITPQLSSRVSMTSTIKLLRLLAKHNATTAPDLQVAGAITSTKILVDVYAQS